MSATITNVSRVHSAISFIANLSGEENVYMYAGKIDPWDDENTPDPVSVSYEEARNVKSSIVFMKKITESDGILGLKRYNWETGTVYTPWAHDKNMNNLTNWLSSSQPFFVFVHDQTGDTAFFSVYMCLDNNNGAASIDMPTGQATNAFVLNDGYRWKFMYNLSDELVENINPAFIPCPYTTAQKTPEHLTVESGVTPGTIDRIRIEEPGSGYTLGNTQIVISGDGSGAEASFTIGIGNRIENITITNPGSNYTYGTALVVGDGVGATASPMISPVNGHGYDSAMQLYASYIMIKQGFVHDEGGLFPTKNSYRRVGLIKNMRDNDGVIISTEKLNLFHELQMSNITGTFPVAQKIIGKSSGATALIFLIDPPGGSSNASFFVIDIRGNFQIGETVELEGAPSILAVITDVINNDINTLSGDVMYSENIQFVTRKTGQSEKFIFTIES